MAHVGDEGRKQREGEKGRMDRRGEREGEG